MISRLARTAVIVESICVLLLIMLLLTPKEVYEASGYTVRIERIK